MKPFLHLKPVSEVEDLICSFRPLSGESVNLDQAAGRRLYTAFHAPTDLPGFVRSRMDGYAVRAADVFGATESMPSILRVCGNCPVGSQPDFTLAPGEAATIVTGAALPAGANAVVMVEDSREAGPGQVELIRSVAPGANIVEADEDARKGQLLIPAGRLVSPPESGIFAAFGLQQLEVFRRPKIAIISTGDEILPIDAQPGPCKLRDVNTWSLDAFCRLHGGLPIRMGIVGDDPKALGQKLRESLELADVVLVSGGSSAGMRDHTLDAFLAMPDSALLVHGVAMSPGKPFILATSGKQCLAGLPGHVTSALVCAHVFLAPLLARLQGQTDPMPKAWITATLGRSVASAQGRRDYIRCRLEKAQNKFVAHPLLSPSAVLNSLLCADGLVVCPENSEGLAKGEQVKFYPLH